MNIKIKTVLGIIIFAAFLTIAYSAYSILSNRYKPDVKSRQQETEKYPAPDFTVTDNQGNEVKLSEFKGKPVVLNFWTSWCPSCKSEMPEFNKVYSSVKNDVVFMMIDLVDGEQETRDSGHEYVTDHGFTFPVFFDITQDAANAYGITTIPATFFIDSEGNIKSAYQGAISEETLISEINSIK